MHDPVPPSASLAQIFSIDVTALSDRLDLSADELLAGLQETTTTRGETTLPKRASVVPYPVVPKDDMSLAYIVCLVVSDRRALREIPDEQGHSVLELSLHHLVGHPPCTRIVVCVTDEELYADVDAIVRSTKRPGFVETPTATIDVLVGDYDDRAAVRQACMYLDATAAIQSEHDVPLAIICVDSRVFDASTIDTLVHRQQTASILTDGLTTAVVLIDQPPQQDTSCPVGLCVCSLRALLHLCEAKEAPTKAKRMEEPHDDTSIDAWLVSELGILHCEHVFATPKLNWAERHENASTLVNRFELGVDETEQSNQQDGDESEQSFYDAVGGGSSIGMWTAIAAIQAELEGDGIAATLVPVPTSVVNHAVTTADQSAVDLFFDLPNPDEQSPLLASCSRTTTVLSEIDLEGPTPNDSNAHAYLIQVDRPLSPSQGDLVKPELIFALPEVLTMETEPNGLLPPIQIRQRTDPLPSCITKVQLEAVILDPPVQPKATRRSHTRRVSVILHVEKQVPMVGYLILLTALFAVSSQGAVLDLLVGVPPLLKLFWRTCGVSFTLLPVAILSMSRKGIPQLPREKRGLALICVLAYTMYNSTFLVALSLTSIGHVYIFANSHSLIMVVGKLLLREPLGALELLGAALGFSGGVVTTLDRSSSSTSTAEDPTNRPVISPTPWGDLIAFSGAFGGVAYLLSAKKLRATLGVRVFLFLLTTGVALVLLPVLIFNHERLGIRLDDPWHPTQGLVGWIHHLDIEAYLVLVCSVCGTMGFIASLKYFDPLVVSVTMLTEPVVATIFSIFIGVERLPGWPTMIGGLAVILGCLLVLLATHRTSQKIDVSDRLVKTPFTSPATVLRGPDTHIASRSSTTSQRRGTYGSLA